MKRTKNLMLSCNFKTAALAALSLFTASTASAHITYGGRTFLNYTGLSNETMTISGLTVSGGYGWADGTDADFGDSHKLRPFRFTLENTALVTISVMASNNGNPLILDTLLPGYSIYSGLAHLAPRLPDHDGAPISQEYLATLPAPAKEGVFNALETWKVGNEDPGVTLADMTTFAFRGYAVDGTSANYGPTPGVQGDGTADGFVSKTFELPQGDYTLFVGGGNYAAQTPGDTSSYGIITTVAVAPVPEPASFVMLGLGTVVAALVRCRRV
jgi:hypothetical protein